MRQRVRELSANVKAILFQDKTLNKIFCFCYGFQNKSFPWKVALKIYHQVDLAFTSSEFLNQNWKTLFLLDAQPLN